MRSFKLPLRTLMVAVLFVGVGFAALKNPTELVASAVFTLTVGLLCVAVLVAIATTGRKRLAYAAFALFGGTYLGFTFGPFVMADAVHPPPLLASTLVKTALDSIKSTLTNPSPPNGPVTMTVNTTATSFLTNTQTSPTYFVTSPNGGFFPFVDNQGHFYQIGYSLATLLIGFLASLMTLLVIALRREPAKS